MAETGDAVEEAIALFLGRAKAPRSWDDIIEIVEVQLTELWDIDKEGELHQHSGHDDIETMLLTAVLTMGGNPIKPKPELEVPAGSVIKPSNRPYSAERPRLLDGLRLRLARGLNGGSASGIGARRRHQTSMLKTNSGLTPQFRRGPRLVSQCTRPRCSTTAWNRWSCAIILSLVDAIPPIWYPLTSPSDVPSPLGFFVASDLWQDRRQPGRVAPVMGLPSWELGQLRSKDAGGITLDARQKDIADKVSSYFSGINTLQGSFLQTDSDDRRMKGKFYLSRPGRFRFDYARPSRQIVISDGRSLAVQDLDLKTEDRVDLDQTPFRLVLSTDVNLVRDAKIMEVEESKDRIIVGLHDKNPDVAGQLTIYLTTKLDLELKGFVTRDALGVETRVEVSDLAKGVQLDAGLFKITP